ncbi:tRNA (adenosine(37)-N6)-threonylcarbamoyltransferase complex ATPase subunit type 1 TsaE [candidate division WOR-1 bacterium RIFOXYA2_FULL_36_21]|uniref:tRNA threonylcarbamoyladenosine biosynthesis protein TsaE n=1 Tax=candidate division WOR-1 bacterium RIFOXYB2_FULL_36_35 TaxID=1802578 RepID=A0A1F4S4G0_UNCSA|nr:MAG: tRNA (adenosine(37)-N6)-threonylcarbamoyltransferase complex ATPase subunit type 1 TsaE [candidate division WOR-1 bacterium RIFOXYA2_FULL_36_21]OGC14285.1 MAG: tRNA (adenosine(37)-N6)-threonylcarbamoyltransferase complex ATPase subunit type 1 TsaE [candidate division WOR-1 bacterium RIFOXYA12_FULL_36_13]OGC15289.1 MAG: tRNA (adenosine(37)-N6)-threonylcarbamoyltransferase complex ATPase subunit type 1 TsaE [candidate division WOR-1 bacterium RIFOXYB2_FULL_36_35]
MKYITNSPKETVKLGIKIGKQLKPNDIIALEGDLGSGKTTLSQGIALGTGLKDYISSPTFTIINEYENKIPLYHIDLYRLDAGTDIKDLGIEEYFHKDGICLIEWAEKLGDLLPENAKIIRLEIKDADKRVITI